MIATHIRSKGAAKGHPLGFDVGDVCNHQKPVWVQHIPLAPKISSNHSATYFTRCVWPWFTSAPLIA